MSPSPPDASPWLGTWSRPPDHVAQGALVAALVLLVAALVPGGSRWLASTLDFAGLADLSRRRRFLAVASFSAAFLSLGYVALYLRGGPRAPDAAGYWLQGRALSHGDLTWTASGPMASLRARGLFLTPGDRLSTIFPPGYPLLVAAGFLVGAPMLIGPLVAAALVVSSWALARELAAGAGRSGPTVEMIARTAAGISVMSAALRYHTADILPQGSAALAITLALTSALRARRLAEPRLWALTGFAVGALVAIRPASSIVLLAVLVPCVFVAPERVRSAAWAAAAAIPGVLLVLVANRAVTGHALATPASMYEKLIEPHGARHFALRVAAVIAARNLRAHAADVANLEPLALLALLPVVTRARGWRSRPALLVALVALGHLVVSAPSLADSAAGAAGRNALAEVLPLEHALIALGLAQLFPRALAPAGMTLLGAALAGFAVHTVHDHQNLGKSGLGRPSFESDVLHDANVTHGLLFFEDDEGYELALDPNVPPSHGIAAARIRGDDHDRLLYDSLGHPAIHRYVGAGPSGGGGGASVASWMPPTLGGDVWRFESEADWPPLNQTGGRAELIESYGSCASAGQALALEPEGSAQASATIELPVPRGPTPPEPRGWNITPRVLQRGGAGAGTLELVTTRGPGAETLAKWAWTDAVNRPFCLELPAERVELGGARARVWLVLTARGGQVALDKVTLQVAGGNH